LNIAASRDCAVINPGALFCFFLEKQKEELNQQGAAIKQCCLLQEKDVCFSFFLDKKRNKKIKDKRMAPPVYPAHAT
jgi:hypothetical protein